MVAAVRIVRRCEATIKAAKKHRTNALGGGGGGGGWNGRPISTRTSGDGATGDGARHQGTDAISGSNAAVASNAGGKGWSRTANSSPDVAEYLWECPDVCGPEGRQFSTLEVRPFRHALVY